jgi:uncharacterized membrane protein YhaH (DUF805 family)
MVALLLIGGAAWLGKEAGTMSASAARPPIAAIERNSTVAIGKCAPGISPTADCPKNPQPESQNASAAPPLEVLAFSGTKDDSPFPWILVISVVLVLGAFSALASLRLPRYLREDSPNFQKALAVWSDWLSERHTTPRSFKRFVNKARFLAMLERGSDAEVEGWGQRIKKWWSWARGASAEPERPDLISAAIVAYAATLTRQPQWRCSALLGAFPLDGGNGDLQELEAACNTEQSAGFDREYEDLWKAVQRHRAEPSFHADNSPAAWLPPPDIQRLIERVITPDAGIQPLPDATPLHAAWATRVPPTPDQAPCDDPAPAGPIGVKSLFLSRLGRINRKQWWLGVGMLAVPSVVLLMGLVEVVGHVQKGDGFAVQMLMMIGLLLALAYPFTFLVIKRLHDIGGSGWWASLVLMLSLLISTIPIVVLVLGCLPGASGENRFGRRRIFRWSPPQIAHRGPTSAG